MFLYKRLTVVFLTVELNWQPPPIGFIKVNWDAVITTKDECIGMGIVARDLCG